jgi:hypothetical protein
MTATRHETSDQNPQLADSGQLVAQIVSLRTCDVDHCLVVIYECPYCTVWHEWGLMDDFDDPKWAYGPTAFTPCARRWVDLKWRP